ncbi:MAG: hypothetical protein ACRBFS_24800 [Aureispira sp.]
MAIQKIGFLCALLVLGIIGLGCSSMEPPKANITPTKEGSTALLSHQKTPLPMNCFDSIHITVEDSVFFYWAEVATNRISLEEHAGNERIVIMQDGRYYYSNNDGPLENFDNYFNAPLSLYKTLSASEFQHLKEVLSNLKLEEQREHITHPDMEFLGGYEGYLYLKNKEQTIYRKIDMTTTVYEDVKAIMNL